MNTLKIIIIIHLTCIFACKPKEKLEPNPYDHLIHNPLSANQTQDSIQIPRLYFKEPIFNFGNVLEGDTVIHEFVYYNTGNATLIITNASSSCGCAIPTLGKKILEPGDSSVLKLIFTTENKEFLQEKEITLFGNTFPSETKILLTGIINKK